MRGPFADQAQNYPFRPRQRWLFGLEHRHSQPPSGGANTGLGGTAPRGPGSPLPWLVVIGADALLIVTGGLRLRRNGLRRSTAEV